MPSKPCFNALMRTATAAVLVVGASHALAAGPTLLISELQANPTGADSPFEWVELLATTAIDFSLTPYTVVVSNNGTANANGWVAGSALSYGFSITSGSLAAGQVGYIGGSSLAPTGTLLRTIATGTTAGDRFGSASLSGVIGNGGGNADGVAVFDMAITSVTSSSVPIDAIFFGSGVGNALVAAGSAGYQLPVNDRYAGGKLQGTSFLAPDVATNGILKATGSFDTSTGTFSVVRSWTASTTFSNDQLSAITLVSSVPEPESLALLLAGLGTLGWLARRPRGQASQG